MKSIWQLSSELPKSPTLKNDIKTDVLIIGGGIAGILTAYFLQQRGVKYILVEKDEICSGTTHNTTAKITYQHGLIYNKLLKSSGKISHRLICAQTNWLLINMPSFVKILTVIMRKRIIIFFRLMTEQKLKTK